MTRWCKAIATSILFFAAPAFAEAPGRGLTAPYEVDFLRFIIDHHFAAVRMTELAAGTDTVRDARVVNPAEGTSPTPGYPPSSAKSAMDELKSMARRENRMQREEIGEAQRFLREWYGQAYEPSVPPSAREMIAALEAVAPGDGFDHLFMEMMSRHHYIATQRVTECVVSVEIMHDDLMRYCRGIWHGQTDQIHNMRKMLCRKFSICDYQPLDDPRGRHSGGPERATLGFGG